MMSRLERVSFGCGRPPCCRVNMRFITASRGTLLIVTKHTLTHPTRSRTQSNSQVKLHSAAVTRLAVSSDDCLLMTAGADGAVGVMDVRDKELAKTSTRRDQVCFWEGGGAGVVCRLVCV
jgi:hypothetical protein